VGGDAGRRVDDPSAEARIQDGILVWRVRADGKERYYYWYSLAASERNKMIAAGDYKVRVLSGADGLVLRPPELSRKKGDRRPGARDLEPKAGAEEARPGSPAVRRTRAAPAWSS
jgi:hypothetical protein